MLHAPIAERLTRARYLEQGRYGVLTRALLQEMSRELSLFLLTSLPTISQSRGNLRWHPVTGLGELLGGGSSNDLTRMF